MDSRDASRKSKLETMDNIIETFFRYKNRLLEQEHLKRNDKLNPTKTNLLCMLYRDQPCMVVDLTRQLNLSSGATTIALNQLEEDGMINKLRSVEDRRSVWLSLSEEGERIAKKIIEFRNKFTEDMMGLLSDKEQEDLFLLLKKIDQRMKERLKNEKP
jgi:MarR family 2-MHQ and catechol resistance regulon transcriptional repressor